MKIINKKKEREYRYIIALFKNKQKMEKFTIQSKK